MVMYLTGPFSRCSSSEMLNQLPFPFLEFTFHNIRLFWSTTRRRYTCNSGFHNGDSIFQPGQHGRPIPLGGPAAAHAPRPRRPSRPVLIQELSFPADTRN